MASTQILLNNGVVAQGLVVLQNDGTNAFPTGGGSGGGSALADVLLIDSNGVLFVQRDNGTTISYVRIDTKATYTPVGTISIPLANGAATQTTLASILTALGSPVQTTTTLATVSNNSEVKLSASFTRPANTTAYVAGYLVANSTTAGSVTPLSFANAVRNAGDCVRIERVRINKNGTSLTNASFRLHLFEASPTVTVGDGAAFNASGVLATNNVLNYAGSFSSTLATSGSDGATGNAVPLVGSAITVSPTSGTTIYGLLEATAAYTPVSGEAFTVVLEGYRT